MARLDFTEDLSIDQHSLGTHLTGQGFSLSSPGRWRRGHPVGAWLGFTPKSWPAEVTAQDGRLTLKVRAMGQILTRAEGEYWEQAWDNLRAAAAGRLTDTAALARQRDVSFVENTLVLVLPFPVSLAAGAVAGIAAGFWAGMATFGVGIIALYAIGVSWLMIRR